MGVLAATLPAATIPLGSICGHVQLPAHVARGAATLADEYFTAAEAADFCGDCVETYAIPLWANRGGAVWLPDLAANGYRRGNHDLRRREDLLVVTAGVEAHTDDEGLVLMVVLHNDDLTFYQGKVRHKPVAGDWFIFDDRKPHGVKEAPGRATFVSWNIPIARV